ncbi:hypothetical protein [Shewanella algae]|uniref:hypothetical protein n=1 Tax=Shewanella algae TaxID=38313 RepID=UPI001185EEDD|nr:hypothetical protein [Shewanella algae]MBO2578136.1 hypothetical protein [Shewanella algae]TVP04743.1 hypothetical protein AYI73_15795 [Shewanella algae]BCV49567.1 hypothetical protein TUM17382_22600 [Shewanella algae]
MRFIETVKIKPENETQGEFVVINKCEFDPDKHELFEQKEASIGIADLRKTLTDAGIEFDKKATKKELQALVDAMDKGE